MASEAGRTKENIELVRGIAAVVADRLRYVEEGTITSFDLFEDLANRVRAAFAGGIPFLTPEQAEQLSQSLRNTTRIYSFFAANNVTFVLALPGMKNVYNAPIVVDVFSPRALDRLGVAGEPPPPDKPEAWPEWEWLIKRLIKAKTVEQVERGKAREGTVALFIDTLRGLANGSAGGDATSVARTGGGSAPPPSAAASTTTTFTVHSANAGYQVDYFPQYRYTPGIFGGAALSTPVSQAIPNGHYCFEGRKGGSPVRDPGVHYAGPGHISTRTTAF